MANWCNELTLISRPVGESDAEGFPVEAQEDETRTPVFANEISVGQTEFYKADIKGASAVLKFEVYTQEYSGQRLCEYEGARYYILRTYRPKSYNGEITELTLSTLPKGGRING